MWAEIVALEQSPALAASGTGAEEARRKIALLKGVLQWDLDKEFNDRLWRLRRNLRETGAALVETQRARRSVDTTMQGEPAQFGEFSKRIEGLSPKIRAMHGRVESAMARHRLYLQSVAVEELQAQKQRLETYTVQARFALAAIYDMSSTVGNAAQ
jgi:hypothetical protein